MIFSYLTKNQYNSSVAENAEMNLSLLPRHVLIFEIMERLSIPYLLNFLSTCIDFNKLSTHFASSITRYFEQRCLSGHCTLISFSSNYFQCIPNTPIYIGFGSTSQNCYDMCFTIPQNAYITNLFVRCFPSIEFIATILHKSANSSEFVPSSPTIRNGVSNEGKLNVRKGDKIVLQVLSPISDNILINASIYVWS